MSAPRSPLAGRALLALPPTTTLLELALMARHLGLRLSYRNWTLSLEVPSHDRTH